ncbi:MAG: DUF5615 family PIN-like protein [Phycisphaeraceae bacterium]|nr:DUF5615 family PIN-like protein [Phycisphaeraceae bacterium]
MKIWVDAQLPPAIAPWIEATFGVECVHIRGTPFATEDDARIFAALRTSGHVILSKDDDFADLVTRLDAPPQILWLRVGNVTNRALRDYLSTTLPKALDLMKSGVALVEMGRRESPLPPASPPS